MIVSRRATVLMAFLLSLSLVYVEMGRAEIVAATLYPGSAQVTERASVVLGSHVPDQQRALIFLPPRADPQTLSVRVTQGKGRILDLSWRRVLREDQERVKILQERMEAQRREREVLESRRLSLEAAVGFWQGLRMVESSTPKAASDMALAVAANVERLHQDTFAVARRIEEADRLLAQLKAELEQARGASREAWEVALLVSGATDANLPLEYEYTVADSGWSPVYRVNALPGDKRVDVTMDAQVWQRTGQDWRNVQLSLATLPSHGPIAPPALRPWIIQPMPPARPMPEPRVGKMLTMEMSSADMAEPARAMTERATYRVWDLGRQSIQTGTTQRLRILHHGLEASFTYLVRPAQGERAFLRAEAVSREFLDLPPGEALLMVDDGVLAKTGFSFAGREQTIFFGFDPLVTAQARLLEHQSGEHGIMARSQTQTWRWQVVIRNAKGYPVDVRMEEPRPQVRDERIKLNRQFDPQPVDDPDEPHLIVWKMTLPANSERTVSWGLRLEAPTTLELDLGWR